MDTRPLSASGRTIRRGDLIVRPGREDCVYLVLNVYDGILRVMLPDGHVLWSANERWEHIESMPLHW